MKFRATILSARKTATGFEVPEEVVETLGKGRRPPVRVTINGHTYLSTVATMGGQLLLPLSAENREAAGVAAGDEVEVEVELDDQPREVEVPADLAQALAGEEEARRTFEGLSYSERRRLVSAVEGAKKAETRERRVAKTVELLREGRAR